MANEYFQAGSVPAPNSPGSSAVMRNEFGSVAAAFGKLPAMAGHQNEIVVVNSSGTSLITSGVPIANYVTKDGVFTLTNKTIAWADNIFPGFGTAATKNAGTASGNVPILAGASKLPALDGSLLTNLNVNQAGTIVDVAHGGTGVTSVNDAQVVLGIDLKADADDAVLTGAPTAPTPPTGDNSARIATTYFVTNTIADIGSFAPSNASPLMDGVASSGVGALGSRDDHRHPTDTTRAPLASPGLTGVPTAPTAAANTSTTQIATTAFVNAEITADRPYSAANPLMNGTAAQGVAANVSRSDHVHPTDTTRAPLASPTFTGDPKAPTPATSDNDTSIATTAFVQSLLAQQPPAGMEPSNNVPLMDGTAAAGTGVSGARDDHRHPTDTTRAPLASPGLTGVPTAPTAAANTSTTQIATTAFVNAEITADRPYSAANPLMNGTAAQGVAANVSRSDHVHPTDTSRLALAGGAMTGALTITANIAEDALRVTQTGAGNVAVFEDSANPDATPVVINRDGKLLVGTSSTHGSAVIQAASDSASSILMQRAGDDAEGVTLVAVKARGTINAKTSINSGDVLVDILSRAWVGTAPYTAGRIQVVSDGPPSDTSMPGRISLQTVPTGSTTAVERMRIDSEGSVRSIGTTKSFGFHTEVASGTGRWGFYSAGAAENFFAGPVRLGGTSDAATGMRMSSGYITYRTLGTSGQLDIDHAPIDGTSKAAVRLFRSTNTTGDVQFHVLLGDNTSTPNHILSANNNQTSSLCVNNGNLDLGNPSGTIRSRGDFSVAQVFTRSQIQNTLNTASTLTIVQLRSGIVLSTPAAAINLTLPTGTLIDAAFISLAVNQSFEWSVINMAAATHAVTVLAGTGHTVVGNMVVAANTSGRFLTRKTATNTFVTFRIA